MTLLPPSEKHSTGDWFQPIVIPAEPYADFVRRLRESLYQLEARYPKARPVVHGEERIQTAKTEG